MDQKPQKVRYLQRAHVERTPQQIKATQEMAAAIGDFAMGEELRGEILAALEMPDLSAMSEELARIFIGQQPMQAEFWEAIARGIAYPQHGGETIRAAMKAFVEELDQADRTEPQRAELVRLLWNDSFRYAYGVGSEQLRPKSPAELARIRRNQGPEQEL